MNRRDFFKGAGAAAMTCLAPVPAAASFGWGFGNSLRVWSVIDAQGTCAVITGIEPGYATYTLFISDDRKDSGA